MEQPEKSMENDLAPERVSLIAATVFERSGRREERPQWVIREQAVTLHLNGQEFVTLLCAGHHLDELAAGFFRAEGFLDALDNLEGIDVDEERQRVDVRIKEVDPIVGSMWSKRTVTSGCGKGSLFYYSLDALLSRPVESSLSLSAAQVIDRVEDLHRLSETYRRTHGVHNCALATPEQILLFRDDIGRHNAVDMIVGHALLHGVALEDKLLLTTGRLTSEMLIKAAKVRLPVVVSRNTATTLAVELAKALCITLIGYARAGKFTVYSGAQRIAPTKDG